MLKHSERLDKVNPYLDRIVRNAAKSVRFDVLVVCGYRTAAAQMLAYLTGKSKALPGKSKHNVFPSKAVDLIACDELGRPEWEALDKLAEINKAMQAEAAKEGIKLTWSKTWKKFVEFNHWEIN